MSKEPESPQEIDATSGLGDSRRILILTTVLLVITLGRD
jgi:hypothetical protein